MVKIVFGLFKKYCQICGMKVDKNKDIVRFGEHFCSEEHAQQFVDERKKMDILETQMKKNSKQKSSGCCCG